MSRWFLVGLLALCPPLAWADPSPPAPSITEPSVILNSQINSGDTAWMLASMALVLMMTVPGLALFYGGMVRRKNVLATLMQSFAITCLVTLLWYVIGYSLAFTPGTPYIGGLSRLFMNGVIYIKDVAAAAATKDTPAVEAVIGRVSVSHLGVTIPETVYAMFQLTFAIITPALICGAFAERMKFSAMLWFMSVWSIIVYAPIPTGCGNRAAGVHRQACSTLPAARWCTSTQGSPRSLVRSLWVSVSATTKNPWRPTTWC